MGVGKGTVLGRFGYVGKPASGAIRGSFYDFKLDERGKPAAQRPSYPQIFQGFLSQSAWALPKDLQPFSPKADLFLKAAVFEGVQDREAGVAFQAPDTQAGLWVAHYHGEVEALQSGKFTLGGWGDNYLIIGLNGKVILDACDTSNESAVEIKTPLKSPLIPGKGGCATFRGPVFELKKGETYRIDLLMGDRGGIFTAGAFVLEEDEVYDVRKVFTEYPMLVFDEFSYKELELYPFISDKALRTSIFKAF